MDNAKGDQDYLLIRLPEDMVKAQTQDKIGSLLVYDNGDMKIVDANTGKEYISQVSSCEQSDLLKMSLAEQKAIHLGKISTATFVAVPKVDDVNV